MLQPMHTNVRQRLTAILSETLRPSSLEVIDESHQHAGHSGSRPEGETHMRVRVVSDVFAGKSRLERHRIVNGLAAAELQRGLHALAIEAGAPGDAGQAAAPPMGDRAAESGTDR